MIAKIQPKLLAFLKEPKEETIILSYLKSIMGNTDVVNLFFEELKYTPIFLIDVFIKEMYSYFIKENKHYYLINSKGLIALTNTI